MVKRVIGRGSDSSGSPVRGLEIGWERPELFVGDEEKPIMGCSGKGKKKKGGKGKQGVFIFCGRKGGV
jgi:hypothetical protein